MNKTKIEWCDSTWNPVTGCRHGCEYCYANRIANRFGKKLPDLSRYPEGNNGCHIVGNKFDNNPYPFLFEPTFHAYRLDEPQHKTKPQTIFVCSLADLFGDWVPTEWIEEVVHACKKAPQHRYLFLTKNPGRYISLARAGILPTEENFWCGSSVTNSDMEFWWSYIHNTFLSIEPMMEAFPYNKDVFESSPYETKRKIDWIIIGAMTGPRSQKHQPKQDWVKELSKNAREHDIPVFMKDSLISIVGEVNMRRELPWEKKKLEEYDGN